MPVNDVRIPGVEEPTSMAVRQLEEVAHRLLHDYDTEVLAGIVNRAARRMHDLEKLVVAQSEAINRLQEANEKLEGWTVMMNETQYHD